MFGLRSKNMSMNIHNYPFDEIRSQIKDNGYAIINDLFELEKLIEIESQLEYLFKYHTRKNNCNLDDKSTLDLANFLYKISPQSFSEIYDHIGYSDFFINLLSSSIFKISREILKVPFEVPLYFTQNRILMQLPENDERLSDWHQETFYTIPHSKKYLQCWFPLFSDSNSENGSIHICPGSHKEGIAKSKIYYPEGRIPQVTVDPSVIKKYEPIQLEIKRGDCIIFDGKLIHKSGYNKSSKTRFSAVSMIHDVLCSDNAFVPKPRFEYRGIAPKDWHAEIFD